MSDWIPTNGKSVEVEIGEVIVWSPAMGLALARKGWSQCSKPDYWQVQHFDNRWELEDVTHYMPRPKTPEEIEVGESVKTELLPCPFCGRQPEIIGVGYHDANEFVKWVTLCCNASKGGCGCSQSASTEKEVWNLWNKRNYQSLPPEIK